MSFRALSCLIFLLAFLPHISKAQPDITDSPAYLLPLLSKSSPNTTRVALQLKLAGYYIFKPGEYKNDLDSAMVVLNDALALSTRLRDTRLFNEALKLKGDCFLEGKDLRHGGECFSQVVNYYHHIKDSLEEENTWVRWGECIPGSFYTERLYCYKQALRIFDKIKAGPCIKIWESSATISVFQNDFPAAIFFCSRLLDYYTRTGNREEKAKTCIYMASVCFRKKDPRRDIYLDTALQLLKQLPVRDQMRETAVLASLSEAHLAEGKFVLAEQEIKQVLSQYRASGSKNLPSTYNILAELYRMTGQPDKRLFYTLEAINCMHASRDSSNAVYFYKTAGETYVELGLYDKSMPYLDTALSLPLKNSTDSMNYFFSLQIKANAFIGMHDPARALQFLFTNIRQGWPENRSFQSLLEASFGATYEALKQYSLSEKHYLSSSQLSKGSLYFTADSRKVDLFHLAQLYVKMHAYGKAIDYLKKAGSIPPALYSADELSRIYLIHFKLDSSLGNYAAAIKYFQLNKTLNDSIFNATKNRQLEEVEIAFETRQKEQSITDLKNHEKIQLAELTKSNAQKKLILVGALLSLVIAGLAYTGFHQKIKSNRLLRSRQKEIDEKNYSLESANRKQKQLLEEKEWLIREIHHRVKNNLQTTISLLHMQSAYLSGDEARTAILNSQRRMQAMSMIHQRLYQSGNMSRIEIAAYIGELTSFLKESFRGIDNITFSLDIQPAEFEVSLAVPLGLIINEAVTNAIKYAFPGQRIGKIAISLKETVDENYLLTISDNGDGMPDHAASDGSIDSLGLSLIRGLTDQLQGEFDIINDKGVTLLVIFKPGHHELDDHFRLQQDQTTIF